jgi:curved DNA-binding protein CbpA
MSCRYSSPEDKAAATRRFQTITEAYQVLRDPKRRAHYDSGMA